MTVASCNLQKPSSSTQDGSLGSQDSNLSSDRVTHSSEDANQPPLLASFNDSSVMVTSVSENIRVQHIYLLANNGDLVLVSSVRGILGFIVESKTYTWVDFNGNSMQWNGQILVSTRTLQLNHEPVLR